MTSEPVEPPAVSGGTRPAITRRLLANGGWWGGGLALGVVLALGVTALTGWQTRPLSDKDVEEIVRRTILNHPELVPQAIDRLQQQQVSQLLASNREAIETPFAGAWAGAKDGDVVLVEFFDFNCPFCRQSSGDVERLLKEDPKLKVVWRDMPVLGPESERFARAALSAAQQGRYQQFYRKVFSGQGALNEPRLIESVRAAGLNEGVVVKDLQSKTIEQEIDNNLALARALGLTGTPSFVVGEQILAGAVGYDALKEAVAKARADA